MSVEYGKRIRTSSLYGVRLLKTGRFLLVLGLLMIFTFYSFSSAALDTESAKVHYQEYVVKAAFLYNFAKFIEWPAEVFEDPSLPLSICIYGKDPFGESLDTIKGKTVKGRKLAIGRYTSMKKLQGCQITFISPAEKDNLRAILESIKDQHMLTVSDIEGFTDHGGIISLNKEDKKIRLEINVKAAEQSGLKMSSKLLKLAKVIHGKK